jgi:hypothetical protein
MRIGAKLSIEAIREFTAQCIQARAVGRQLLARQVEKLDFATEAARTLILADIAEYPMMTPDLRQKAKDRLYKALTAKPPDEGQEAKRQRQQIELSGQGFTRPSRFSK